MRSNIHRVVSIGSAHVFCLAIALVGLPAVAGVNRWTTIGPEGASVHALAIDPRTPTTAYAGTRGAGVLKTTDGGASWVVANSGLAEGNVNSLAIDPSTPSTLYAGTDSGAYKSTRRRRELGRRKQRSW